MKLSIDKKWKWAAMDQDGSWSFYMDKPEIGYNEWQPENPFEEGLVRLQYITVSSVIKDFPHRSNWKESLHQIINGQLVKYELPLEPPAIIRAREILEEIGYFDVQGTPAEQLKPLVDLIETLDYYMKIRIMNGEPDATLKLSVEGETSIKFHKTMKLTTAEFACYLVSKS